MPIERADRLRAWDAAPAPLITPSLLNCDFARVGRGDRRPGGRPGSSAVHLDVMDGHFVPNLSYGPPVIADWRPLTDLPFDAHLMMTNPAEYLDAFVEAGADSILFHIEVVPRAGRRCCRRIRDRGCRAGAGAQPADPARRPSSRTWTGSTRSS